MLKLILFPLLVSCSGCVFLPDNYESEQRRMQDEGVRYLPPVEERKVPEIGSSPTSSDLLRRAFFVSGELESAYFDWVAAMAEVREMGAYPNSPLQLNFQYMFSKESMKAWDRTTLTLQPNPMFGLSLPHKVAQKAEVALRNAQRMGEKFLQAKFNLQKELLSEWVDFGLMAEKIRVQETNLRLLQVLQRSAQKRLESGESQVEFLKAGLEISRMTNDIENMRASLRQMQARINGMLLASPESALQPPASIPVLGKLKESDAELLKLGLNLSPELKQFKKEVEGKEQQLELARMEFLPDIMPMIGISGSISQMLGGSISLASSYRALQAQYDRVQAELRSARAMSRAKQSTLAAQLVATLLALRNTERNIKTLEEELIPAARTLTDSSAQYYVSGLTELMPYLDSQRSLLELEFALAESRAEHEKVILLLESLLGKDLVNVI